MTLKIREIYSPSFDPKPRKNKNIRFLIFHYTGMKKEKEAIKRLVKIQSQVSTHYFIRKNGEIIRMVPDLFTAWHAGDSQWGKYRFLNKNSIGIEISNPGHQFGYVNFSKKQINSLTKLTKILIKKYKIKPKNLLGHSDVAPDRKKDPGEKFPWKKLYKKKLGIWHNLSSKKLNYLRRKSISVKENSFFIRDLAKFGYPNITNFLKNKQRCNRLLTIAFQRRFRPELINGKVDQECLLIIKNLRRIKV